MRLAEVNKPSPDELKNAIRLLKAAGLPLMEVQRLIMLFNLGPPPPAPPLTSSARFEKMEVLQSATEGFSVVWRKRWVQVTPRGALCIYKVDLRRGSNQSRPPANTVPIMEVPLHRTYTQVAELSAAFQRKFGRLYAFAVTTIGPDAKSKVVTLAAASPEQLTDWMQCINNCRVRDNPRQLSIWQAARLSDMDTLRHMCADKETYHINEQNPHGCTPLHIAIKMAIEEAKATSHGAKDADPRRALMVVAYLLTQGADPRILNDMNEDAEALVLRLAQSLPATMTILTEMLQVARRQLDTYTPNKLKFDELAKAIAATTIAKQQTRVQRARPVHTVNVLNRTWKRREKVVRDGPGSNDDEVAGRGALSRSPHHRPSTAPPGRNGGSSLLGVMEESEKPKKAKKSDPEYWQWIFVEKGRLQGLRVVQAKGLQSTTKAKDLMSRLGIPVDARYGRPLSAPGFRKGSLKELRSSYDDRR